MLQHQAHTICMGFLLVILVILYAFVKAELIGYWFHRLMHSTVFPAIHRRHMEHHEIQYPRKNLSSENYRHTEGLSTFWLFFPLVILMGILHLFLLPLYLFIPYFTVVSVAGLIQDYLHEGSHLRGFWLNKYKWYRRMRARHHVHHVYQGTNFGIYLFGLDRVFGTYYKKK